MSKFGMGNIKDMYCARLPEVLSLRNDWIRKHTLETLIRDYRKLSEVLMNDKRS